VIGKLRAKMAVACTMLAMVAVSCSAPTQLAESWSDPGYAPKPVKKVMVVGLGESQRRVIVFEDAMASQFAARKLEAIKGNTITKTAGDLESFKEAVRQSGAELVTISRLVDVSDESVYHPGGTAYMPMTGYYGMGPYYSSAYVAVNDPGYVTTSKVYKVETNVYDVATEKLVWSGLSKTTDPTDLQQTVNEIAAVVIQDLVGRKIIP
jgi:hypothetical protein